MPDYRALHDATTALRAHLNDWLGELVPPYADEVLHDLEETAADPHADAADVRAMVAEAESTMEMLPAVPEQWAAVKAAAEAAGVA